MCAEINLAFPAFSFDELIPMINRNSNLENQNLPYQTSNWLATPSREITLDIIKGHCENLFCMQRISS